MKELPFSTATLPSGVGQDLRGPAVAFVRAPERASIFGETAVVACLRAREEELARAKERASEIAGGVASRNLLARGSSGDQAVDDRRGMLASGLLLLRQQLQGDGYCDHDLDSLLSLGNMASSALKSGFEGWSSYKAANWWARVIAGVNSGLRLFSGASLPQPVTDAMRTLAESAKAIVDAQTAAGPLNIANPDVAKGLADRFMGQILGLPPGSSYCLAGGWAGTSPHAMVYRFENIGPGRFNVYVYNAQEDSEQSEGGRRTEGKAQSRPCYVFENVTSEELFFTTSRGAPPPNSVLLQKLLALQEDSAVSKKRCVEDVLGLFCRLQSKLVSGSRFRDRYIRTQRAGNCTIKSVNCLLLDLLGDAAAYKKLMLDERFLGLLDYWNAFCQPPFNRLDDRGQIDVRGYLRHFSMLRRAARNFLTILDKNYRRGVITDLAAYEQAFATINQMLADLQTSEKAVKAARPCVSEALAGSRPVSMQEEQRRGRSVGAESLMRVPDLPPSRGGLQVHIDAELGKTEPWSSLGQVIQSLKGNMQNAAGADRGQTVISQFELTMGNIFARLQKSQTADPDGHISFSGLPEAAAPAVQEELEACLQLYMDNVNRQNGLASVRVQNAGMEALALSFSLARWQEGNHGPLSQFGLYIGHFERLSGRPDMVYAPQDVAAVEQRNAIIQFWRSINSRTGPDRGLFNFESQKLDDGLVRDDKVPEMALYKSYQPTIEAGSVPEHISLSRGLGLDRFGLQRLHLFTQFEKGDFPPAMAHLWAMKRTAMSAFTLFAPGGATGRGNCLPGWYGISMVQSPALYYENGINQWWTTRDDIFTGAPLEGADYPGLPKKLAPWEVSQGQVSPPGRFTAYAANRQHRHLCGAQGIQSENDLLASAQVVDPADRDLVLSEPAVQTSLLLEFIGENLTELSNPDWRAYVETEFFKTFETASGITVSPLAGELRNEQALITQLDQLTDSALNQLVVTSPGDPRWREMLFILRLRASVLANKLSVNPDYRLSREPPRINSAEVNERIFKWLKDYDQALSSDLQARDLLPERRAEIMLAKRELALVRAGLLLGVPAADLDLKATGEPDLQLGQRADLFELMMKMDREYQAFSRVESRVFLRECRHRFASRRDIWQVPRGSEAALAERIVRAIDPHFTPRPGWRATAGELILDPVPLPPEQPVQAGYVVDLTRPMVFRNGCELGQATLPVTADFSRLFENRQFEVRQEGPDTFYFQDDNWGRIEIHRQGRDMQIWRWFPEGPNARKYIYRRGNPEQLAGQLQINAALCYDHVHWFQPETGEVLIFDIHDGRLPRYRIGRETNGMLVDCRDEAARERSAGRPAGPGSSPLEFCLLPKGINPAVERFDDIGQVNAWTRSEHAGQTVFSRIEFPRFQMQDSCLRFDWDGRGWVYAADRRFRISSEPSVPLLDSVNRYLHLVQEEPDLKHPGSLRVVQRKVLIPAGQISAAGFEQYSEIGLPDTRADGNKLALKYFEYDYDEAKNELVPLSDEGRIYLAHLYLSQKRYQEARALLNKISMGADVSVEAVELMKKLLKSGEDLHDLSPNACAIRLQAYLIFKKIKPRDDAGEPIDYDKIGDKDSEHQTMADVYKAYLFGIRAVEGPLVFDPETEWDLFKFLNVGDELGWRRIDLLREIAIKLQGEGRPLTSEQQAGARVVSPTASWELPAGSRVAPAWRNLTGFLPSVPFLHALSVTQGDRGSIPYKYEKYEKFAEAYERIRAQPQRLEREGVLYELLYPNGSLDCTSEQVDFLMFVAAHPEEPLFGRPMPARDDLEGRWRFYDELFRKYRFPQRYAYDFSPPPAASPAVPLPVVLLPPQARPMPALLAPAPPLPLMPAAPLVFAGWDVKIASWQEACLRARPPTPAPSPGRHTPPPDDLTQREKLYDRGIAGELGRYLLDREIARGNEAERPVLLDPDRDPRTILPPPLADGTPDFDGGLGLERAKGDAERQELLLREHILALVNKPPADIHAAIAEQLRRQAEARAAPDINTILRAAAIGPASLQRHCPFLMPPELQSLRALCLDLMVVTTTRQHIDRILKPLTRWRDAVIAGQPVDPQWKQEFVETLAQPRTYNPYDSEKADYFPLLFEYMSGMRVWGNQASIIKKVLEKVVTEGDPELQNIVFQRIMAGGKTSVIISALLEIISGSGQLPIVLCHHSQYTSVSGNLHNFQESRYGKDVYAIDYEMRQLSDPAIVQEMIAKIQEADQRGCALLMKSSMPQVIELKFVMEALRLTEVRGQISAYRTRLVSLMEERVRHPRSDKVQAEIDLCTKDIQALEARVAAMMRNVGLLAQVINIFKAKGVGVLDECDIILSMLTEVNVPSGEEEMLTPERAEFVQEIYSLLVSDEQLPLDPRLPLDQPPVTIRQFIDLENNNQAKVSDADFNGRVAPFLARKVFESSALRLHDMPELAGAFIRYVIDREPDAFISDEDQVAADDFIKGAMGMIGGAADWEARLDAEVRQLPSRNDRESNIKFLCCLTALKRSGDKYKSAAADKIALAKRIIHDVLPLALSRSCDRSYGRDPEHDNGMVIPFLGVNAPATTRFGYVYLALCYQFQAALNNPISLGELRYLAERLGSAAQDYAKKARDKRRATFEEQPEARWFYEITGGAAGGGVRLSEALKDEVLLRRALQQINAEPRRRLAIEAEVAPFHVRYYRERVSSSPVNFAEQMHKLFGCSGTPWNWHSYHRRFGALEADRGVEGKIINAMIERAAQVGADYPMPSPYGPNNVYQPVTELANDGLQPILDRLRNHPQRHRVRALIDAGGFLKGTNNVQAAEAILGLHHDPAFCDGQPPAIDAVIYLHQFSAAEVAAGKPKEKFVMLKRLADGSTQREELPDTSAATIASCGVRKERVFVLFDELRATGTDIPMAADTICLQTVDPHMPVRTLLQATLRARGYFHGQDCEFLVTRRGRSEMLNGGATLQDIIDTLIKNQAVADGEQTFRSYMAQITNAVRVAVLHTMLGSNEPDKVAAMARRHRGFLVSSFVDDPYSQFGRVEGRRQTEEILFRHSANTLFAYYWRRLNLEMAQPGETEPERLARVELLAAALRGYVEQVLRSGQVLDSATLELEKRRAVRSSTPADQARLYLYASLGRGQDVGVEAGILKILASARQLVADGVLPRELRQRQSADVEAQVEVEQDVEIALGLEMEQEQEMRQELQQELNQINLIDGRTKYEEQPWNVSPILPGGLLDSRTLGRPGVIRSVHEVCAMPYPRSVTTARFAPCFPPNLFMTENLRRTFSDTDLPLLHRKMKNASFMLMIESEPPGSPMFVLLSKKDAVYFKNWIRQFQPRNAWLVNMQGQEVVSNRGQPLRVDEPAFSNAVWAANLFNGNVSYLERHRDQTLDIFESDPARKTLMCDFVVMRAAASPHKKRLALMSDLIVPSEAVREKRQGVVFSARRKMAQQRYEVIRRWGPEIAWAEVGPELVAELRDTQLQYLVTAEQIASVHDDRLQYLSKKEQVALLQNERLHFLKAAQASLLSERQIAGLDGNIPGEKALLRGLTTKEQLALIRPENVQHLSDRQINLLAPERLPLLGDEQIKNLSAADLSRWPSSDPTVWRLAMVRDEVAILASPRGQTLRANADGVFRQFGANHGLVANWLIPHLRDQAVLQSLPPERVNMLVPRQLPLLDSRQIDDLTDPVLIDALAPDQVRGHFVGPAREQYRQHISRPECMLQLDSDAGLTPTQRRNLLARINGLLASDLAALPVWCNTEAYAWPRIQSLNKADFEALRQDQKVWVRAKVQSLSPDELAVIAASVDPRSPNFLENHYLDMLSPAQLSRLDSRHVGLLMRMSGDKLRELTEERVINLVPVGRFGDLADNQIQNIADPRLINGAIAANRGFLQRLQPGQHNAVAQVEMLLDLENLDIASLTEEKQREIAAYLASRSWAELKVILIRRPWTRPLALDTVLRLDNTAFDRLSQDEAPLADRDLSQYFIANIQSKPVATIADRLNRGLIQEHFLRFLTVGRQLDRLNVANPEEVELLNRLPRERLQLIKDRAVLQVLSKRRQADLLSDDQLAALYPRRVGLRLVALVGLISSALLILPLFFLLAQTYRDWWRLASAGFWSQASYIAARRICLRH